MQQTGIVRRIDELGRVVIPKEMRKTLRIREGDPLEIYANKEEVVFRKYSPVTSVGACAEGVAESIGQVMGKECYIADTDAIVYVSDNRLKEYVGKSISQQTEKYIKERKTVLLCKSDGGTVFSICKGDDGQWENMIIVPIVAGCDCYGAVVVCDRDKSARFSTSDVKFVSLGATFISKQFE